MTEEYEAADAVPRMAPHEVEARIAAFDEKTRAALRSAMEMMVLTLSGGVGTMVVVLDPDGSGHAQFLAMGCQDGVRSMMLAAGQIIENLYPAHDGPLQ